jgi:hypothetical protein
MYSNEISKFVNMVNPLVISVCSNFPSALMERVSLFYPQLRERTHSDTDPPNDHQDLDLLSQLVARDQDRHDHKAANDRGPRLEHGAPSGDHCEPAEQAVADVGHISMAEDDLLAKESGESSNAPGESGGHGGSTHCAPLAVVATEVVGA